ncbi:DNA cytosine methyltransferase [Stratiformator vulcanicus]|uniref:Cytosine-specific methyltransferase n=1 Tax=Stratiformator vulcanicus TaxID=2527980 RepID=A0A517QZ43_9PLAN|nr:DNA cytosine methyltransferase [Stratiformator vulcanicus]QDT36810.1 putative BsuMI modification methylase subunit YdiO [Stratiformator vulcanicus]
MSNLRAIDLFSGCGGLTVGLEDAGYRVVGAIERDDDAATVYALNHPDVHLWHCDIREVNEKDVRGQLSLKVGELDLLAACPPCQGFSTIRTRNGLRPAKDPRNSLIREVARFAEKLRPKFVLFENVPALARNRRFSNLVKRLSDTGYSTCWKICDAADYGVPQRRKRLVLLATSLGSPEFTNSPDARETVRDAIAGLPVPGNSGDELHDLPERRTDRIREMIHLIPHDGGSRSDLPEKYMLPCHRACNGFKDVYGRMHWDRVAPTITTGCFNPSRGRFLHPEQDRCISLREASLLQDFPGAYTFPAGLGKQRIATLIGNAFPRRMVSHHAAYLSTLL